MSSWYYVKEGQRNGPVDRAELDARVAEGVVGADTLVWRTGMPAWVEAGTVAELGFPPSPPPLPSAQPETSVEESPAEDEGESRGWAVARARAHAMKELAEARAASAPELAGFWVRFAAKFIDLVILYGIGRLVERAVAKLYFDGVAPMPPDWEGWLRMVSISAPINLAIVLAYSVYFIRRYEATPGKRMLGLRVVRADGGRLGVGRVIGRYFAEQLSGLLFLVGYVMAAFDDEKRALHDYMCDTRVVKGEREEG